MGAKIMDASEAVAVERKKHGKPDPSLRDKTPKQIASKKVRFITITLSEPIPWGDETITELTLRRPKAADLEHLSDRATIKELLFVAQKCAGVPARVIKELDGDDAMEVIEAVADFLDGGQKTGKKRSF
jgi:hypothetical protein